MARGSDAVAAVTMALLAVVLLVLWRNGTLRRFTMPIAEGYSDIANRGAAPRMTAVDVLPGAGGAPHIAANASRASAPAGVPTNGFTPTGPVAGTTPLYMRIPDPVVPTMKVAEDLTKIVTLIPDSALDRQLTGGGRFVPDWGIGTVSDFTIGGQRYVRAAGGEKFSPAMLGGGGGDFAP